MKRLTVNEQDNGTEFRVQVGDEVTVRLEAVPGAGYSWMISEKDESALSQVGESAFERAEKPILGGAEQQVFSFRAVSSGVRRLEFVYRRPWEKPEARAKSFSITVVTES